MSIIYAIVLGIVQGLTEYLPISSSGHLILVPWLFGWDEFADDESLKKAFDVALHIGTLAGAVAYFRRDIGRLARAALLDRHSADGRLAWYVALSAVPTAVVGALLTGSIEARNTDIWLIAVMLIVGGLGLAWADGTLGKRSVDDLRPRDVVYLSLGQVLSLQPGVSRAGITITIGRFVGLARDAATRFAFLMALPITFGAIVYKYVDIGGYGGIPSDMRPAFVVGTLASGITGYLAVWGLIRMVRSRSFASFVLYRLIAGAVVLALLGVGFG